MDVSSWPLVACAWACTGLASNILATNMFARTWTADAVTSRPEDVELAFTPSLVERCQREGLPVLDPLPLTPYQVGARSWWRRTRHWVVFLPNGGVKAISGGALEVRVGVLPARTHLKFEDVGDEG